MEKDEPTGAAVGAVFGRRMASQAWRERELLCFLQLARWKGSWATLRRHPPRGPLSAFTARPSIKIHGSWFTWSIKKLPYISWDAGILHTASCGAMRWAALGASQGPEAPAEISTFTFGQTRDLHPEFERRQSIKRGGPDFLRASSARCFRTGVTRRRGRERLRGSFDG